MQHLEVSGAVRHIYIYIYIYVIRRLKVNLGTRRGGVASITPRPPFTPGKYPVPIVQEAGWAPEPVWISAENLAPPGFDPRTFQTVASRYTD